MGVAQGEEMTNVFGGDFSAWNTRWDPKHLCPWSELFPPTAATCCNRGDCSRKHAWLALDKCNQCGRIGALCRRGSCTGWVAELLLILVLSLSSNCIVSLVYTDVCREKQVRKCPERAGLCMFWRWPILLSRIRAGKHSWL